MCQFCTMVHPWNRSVLTPPGISLCSKPEWELCTTALQAPRPGLEARSKPCILLTKQESVLQVTREHTGGPGCGHLVLPLTPTRHAEPSAGKAQGPLQQHPQLSGTQSTRRLRGSTSTHLQRATLPRVLVCSSPPQTREGVIGALSPPERWAAAAFPTKPERAKPKWDRALQL